MPTYKFDPITNIQIENPMFGSPSVTFYRFYNNGDHHFTRPLTTQLVELIEKYIEAFELMEDEGEASEEGLVGLTKFWFVPSRVTKGYEAMRNGESVYYLKRWETIEEVMRDIESCGDDVTKVEAMTMIGMFWPVETKEEATQYKYKYLDDDNLITVTSVVHGRIYQNQIKPFIIDGKFATDDRIF